MRKDRYCDEIDDLFNTGHSKIGSLSVKSNSLGWVFKNGGLLGDWAESISGETILDARI